MPKRHANSSGHYRGAKLDAQGYGVPKVYIESGRNRAAQSTTATPVPSAAPSATPLTKLLRRCIATTATPLM